MFSVIKQGFCSKLTSEFDTGYSQVSRLQNQLNQYSNSLRINLSDHTGFSPHTAISQFENSVQANIFNMVPNLSSYDELELLINTCLYTRNNSMLSKPFTMARAIFNSVQSNAYTFLNNLASMIPTEFNISSAINNLVSFLNISGITLSIPNLNQALVCMNQICNINIGSRSLDIQSFMSKYYINDFGEFDHNSFLSAEGLAAEPIEMINKVKYQVDYINTQIEDSFSSGIERLKTLFPDEDD
jgi:hypothetical protein